MLIGHPLAACCVAIVWPSCQFFCAHHIPPRLGIPRRCTTSSLEEMFAKFGEVVEISRSMDPNNPQLSRMWVTYVSFREASSAIENLNGIKIDEVHQLKVVIALSEEEIARRKQAKLDEEAVYSEITQVNQTTRSSLYLSSVK